MSKEYSDILDSVDVIHLVQEPTPPEFKPSQIIHKKLSDPNLRMYDHNYVISNFFVSSRDPELLYQMGQQYYFEEKQTSKDFQKAFKYFFKAASKGHPDAQFRVGM